MGLFRKLFISPKTKLTPEEQDFINKCNAIANRLGFNSIKNLSAEGMTMVILEANGYIEPWQNETIKKYISG